MKDINRILIIVLIIITGILLYLSFRGNGHLSEALRIIDDVQKKVQLAKDSISKAQQNIDSVLKKIKFTENEMKILKIDRDRMVLEEHKQQAKDWEDLNQIKKEIKENEAEKSKLLQEAKKFEL